ncbi:FtsW/RodA/SpoVE family cell cycle protein [Mammaliicoccus fleurettii]|uniref:FtsW/RodA/SpoVE family cell cycle protein n=1 Tax=Mammaliicoccus fleurettii TaxID=150056 RepID=UPI002DBC2248|nr:FtsW/RodA/SpoVE family cell cycle protein [Mammaliicoccus fleurettii]MEB7725225.1 FtsW/RodA/SpoVE family cell cycle protein [Mammaliicoccus fleurettii]MEB7780867.1 FtsW/RodA/SpoVE family cell cycle protein [Mammaliicoccus fleurettii]
MLRIIRSIRIRMKYLDIGIMSCFIILSIIGVVMIYSASMVAASRGSLTNGVPVEANFFMKRQYIFVILGFILLLIISMYFNINALKNSNMQKLIVLGTIALLFLTLIVGKEINGSKNWINLGLFSIQTSEFLKLVAIFYLAFILDKLLTNRRSYQLKNLVPPLSILGLGLVLVLIQGDLGGTLLTLAIIASILIYSDIKNKIKLQIFINLGGISGLIPLTGVTLPLLSYGCSSMLSISIALGSMLAVIRQIKKEKFI